MGKSLAGMIVILFSIGFLLVAGEKFNQSAAEREYARAAMVREQSQARQDLLAGALPYVGIIAIVALGGGVMIATFIIGAKYLGAPNQTQQPPQLRIIERYYIVLPEGANRRAAWDLLAERRQKVIGGGND